MERRIGELFEYNGYRLIVKKAKNCDGCFFQNRPYRDFQYTGFCGKKERRDGNDIIFKLWNGK